MSGWDFFLLSHFFKDISLMFPMRWNAVIRVIGNSCFRQLLFIRSLLLVRVFLKFRS